MGRGDLEQRNKGKTKKKENKKYPYKQGGKNRAANISKKNDGCSDCCGCCSSCK